MLIFHNFPSHEVAQNFAGAVRDRLRLKTQVFDTQEKSDQVDIFPFQLTAPIVLVDRNDVRGVEDRVKALAEEFMGQFAGT